MLEVGFGMISHVTALGTVLIGQFVTLSSLCVLASLGMPPVLSPKSYSPFTAWSIRETDPDPDGRWQPKLSARGYTGQGFA
jgi:hypothetical protein